MENEEIFDFGGDEGEVLDPQEQDDSLSIFGSSSNDSEGEQASEESEEGEEEYGDYIDSLLKARGIDRNNIEITNENGEVESVAFDDLSDEDKIAILSAEAPEQEPEDSGITDGEIQLINYFRQNRIGSLQEFAEGIAQQAVQNYIANHTDAPNSDIDVYSDEEIIAYDYIQRFGEDMTDDEIDAEIERLKQDEEAFQKRVNLLRSSYKAQEEAERKLYEENESKQKEADNQAFVSAYNSAAYNLNTIQGIDLDDADKSDILDYVLTKDQFGKTQLSKDLDDPEKVLKMAWFMKYGEAAAEDTRNYFAKLLAQQRAPQPAKPKAVTRQKTNAPQQRQVRQSNSFKF